MDYLIIKSLHVLCSVVLVGTGFGTAFYLYSANRHGSVEGIALVMRLVVRADWWFTTPAVILQPATGAYLMHQGGWSLSARWILTSIALYCLTGACWLPVVVYQVRMKRLSQAAQSGATALPADYWRLARRWELLGYPAFLAMVVVYFLMVMKPA